MKRFRWWLPGLALVSIVSIFADAQAAPEPAPDARRVQELEERVRILERKLEIQEEDTAAKKKDTAVVTASDKGFALSSPDKNFEIKLRGVLQADGRFGLDDDDGTFNDKFLLRRVRPIIEGTVYKNYGFRITPDFGNGSAVVQDAYVEANFLPEVKLRAGKFKGPVGLERLQSATDIRFVERGFPTNLVPNRDVGLQVSGDLFGNTLAYAVGVFNGASDGGSNDEDISDSKDFEGRVFATPLRNHFGPFQNLGFGFASTYGDTNGSGDLGKYKTPGQQTFFSYRSSSTPTAANTTVADGARYRLAPQANWYYRQFGLLGEWVLSSQKVRLDTASKTLGNQAWQIAGSWILTGEENSYKGVTPSSPFSISGGTWGAWEFVGRYGQLKVDEDAFPIFADPDKSASEADSWGLGLNWYLNRNVRLEANYEQTYFDGGRKDGTDRDDEQAFLTRLQLGW